MEEEEREREKRERGMVNGGAKVGMEKAAAEVRKRWSWGQVGMQPPNGAYRADWRR